MKRKLLLAAAAAALLSGAIPRPALAEEERVQLKVFTVTGAAKQTAKPKIFSITLFLHIRDSADAARLCKLSPRYREAVLYRLSNKLYPLTDKLQLDVEAIKNDLEPVVRKIDRGNLILKIDVVQGAPKVNKNTAVMFDRTGCIKLRKPR